MLTEVKSPTGLKLTRSDTDGVWLHFDVDGETVSGIRLDNNPNYRNRMKWAERQFEAAAAKRLTDKTPEVSAGRPQITEDNINNTFTQIHNKTKYRLNEKGAGILISRHEMLGVITEEYTELCSAIENCDILDVEDELVDITVAGIVSLASLKTGKVEW